MDQVRLGLAAIKKHHFWVLCGVAVLLGMAIWWWATRGLAAQINERKSSLESTHDAVLQITTGGKHPNQKVIDEIKTEHDNLTKEVLEAWTILYKDQKDRNKWPPELGPDFHTYMELLGPDEPIPERMRDTYMYFIRNHFPEMYEIVDIRLRPALNPDGTIMKDDEGKPIKVDPFETRVAGRDLGGVSDYGGSEQYGEQYGSGGVPTPMGTTQRTANQELVGKVFWNMNDLKRIRNDFYWATQPKSIQVRLAQEDLWVYEALLRIIAKTNEHATSHYNAAVKRIEALEIGKQAAAVFAQLYGQSLRGGGMTSTSGSGAYEDNVSGSAAEDEDGSAFGGPAMPMTMPGSFGGSPGFGSSPGSYDPEAASVMPSAFGPGRMPAGGDIEEYLKMTLLHGRYVGKDGMPLAATDTQPFAEFKMMPIRMVLLVDQRRISRFLVNCANSSMPVEVRRVSINPGKGGVLDLGRPSSAGPTGMPTGLGGGFGEDSASDMYEETGSSIGSSMGQLGAVRRQDREFSYDIPIELLGIIYIFNPPDKDKLGRGGEAAVTAPTGPPAAAPTGPPAAAPTGPPAAAPTGPPAAAPTGPPAAAPTGPPAAAPTGPPAAAPTGPPATGTSGAPPASPATGPPAP